MACIDNIVTTGLCADGETSTSGFTLLQAEGMSLNNFANITTETYRSGLEMVLAKKQLAITQVKNDFLAALAQNNVMPQIANPKYDSSRFVPSTNIGSGSNRGVIIRKSKSRGALRKHRIDSIEVYPFGNGQATIKIIDGDRVTSWAVNLVANQINSFTSTEIGGLPYDINNDTVRVYVDTDVNLASSEVICRTGCNGTVPNDCAYANGWDGSKEVKSEGYGVNVIFYCECDYTQIICDSAPSFGEIIWLKWQINILREQQLSNRLNDLVIYSQEELPDYISRLNAEYVSKWNGLMAGMYSILNRYRDYCLNCRGIKWVVNV